MKSQSAILHLQSLQNQQALLLSQFLVQMIPFRAQERWFLTHYLWLELGRRLSVACWIALVLHHLPHKQLMMKTTQWVSSHDWRQIRCSQSQASATDRDQRQQNWQWWETQEASVEVLATRLQHQNLQTGMHSLNQTCSESKNWTVDRVQLA